MIRRRRDLRDLNVVIHISVFAEKSNVFLTVMWNQTPLMMNGAVILGKTALTKQTSPVQDQLSLMKLRSQIPWKKYPCQNSLRDAKCQILFH